MDEEREVPEAVRTLASMVSVHCSQSHLARLLGVSQQTVWNWINCVSKPTPARREVIERVLGIPVRSWLTSSELAIVNEAMFAARRSKSGEHQAFVIEKPKAS